MLLKSEGQGLCKIDIRLQKTCASNAFLNKLHVTKDAYARNTAYKEIHQTDLLILDITLVNICHKKLNN